MGLKYCGGCQARYDRMAALQTVRSLCPAGTVFEPVEADKEYDYMIIVENTYVDALESRSSSASSGLYSDHLMPRKAMLAEAIKST
ncbi:hypothetical protein [Pseudoflavonifractor phocaeensis]|uniref:hypothetical protein n=1 Tax=Pseudoflavonifractor phocaeensis TaxID=1870988 RepID=UPI0019584C4B|nr:hypothetical protein [Pseudoflavonifractor phocaeensis]MBM6927360.1 hypothetical protein [Pseudoflavonifractor phocaeensis]